MPRRRMYFFRYMTMFFLGASAVMLGTYASVSINTSLNNAVQYIQKIVLTNDGGNSNNSTTGIMLDGSNGNAFFSGNVGIGTSSTSERLTVDGNVILTPGGNNSYPRTLSVADSSIGDGYPLGISAGDAYAVDNHGGNLYLNAGSVGSGIGTGNGLGGNVYINGGVGGITNYDGNVILANSRGKVGIGTIDPSEALDVNGNIALEANYGIYAKTTDDHSPFQLHLYAADWGFSNNGAGIKGGNVAINGGRGSNGSSHGGGNGGDVYIYGGMGGVLPGNVDTGAYGNIILGYDGTNVAGNVGIGTDSPSVQLEVNGSSWIKNIMSIGSSSIQSGLILGPILGTGNSNQFVLSMENDLTMAAGTGRFTTPNLFLDTAGNVGIGTNILGAKLTVNGGIKLMQYDTSHIEDHDPCLSSQRGTIAFDPSDGVGTNSDEMLICLYFKRIPSFGEDPNIVSGYYWTRITTSGHPHFYQ